MSTENKDEIAERKAIEIRRVDFEALTASAMIIIPIVFAQVRKGFVTGGGCSGMVYGVNIATGKKVEDGPTIAQLAIVDLTSGEGMNAELPPEMLATTFVGAEEKFVELLAAAMRKGFEHFLPMLANKGGGLAGG